MALAAKLSHQPLVFPSLGPTAFLLFYRPHAQASCPRNALAGHLIGALSGLSALTAFGLLGQGPALTHLSAARIGAAAMSLGLTAGGMIWAGTPHPPAGATTLIVSLGFLHTPAAVAVLMVGVALLVDRGSWSIAGPASTTPPGLRTSAPDH
jgi:CBS-domain-containing membrane protein